jgi:hypothetical protein
MPTYLYRYRVFDEMNLEFMRQEIQGCQIYLASVAQLNDPEEIHPEVRFHGSKKDILGQLIDIYRAQRPNTSDSEASEFSSSVFADINSRGGQLRGDIVDSYFDIAASLTRIACFSETPDSPLMWSHYASFVSREGRRLPQGGVCLQYYVDESWAKHVRAVQYTDTRPILNRVNPDISTLPFVKGKAWAHEREWRIVKFFNVADAGRSDLDKYAKMEHEKFHLCGIVFGINSPPIVKSTIRQWIHDREDVPLQFQCYRQHHGLGLVVAEIRNESIPRSSPLPTLRAVKTAAEPER